MDKETQAKADEEPKMQKCTFYYISASADEKEFQNELMEIFGGKR